MGVLFCFEGVSSGSQFSGVPFQSLVEEGVACVCVCVFLQC